MSIFFARLFRSSNLLDWMLAIARAYAIRVVSRSLGLELSHWPTLSTFESKLRTNLFNQDFGGKCNEIYTCASDVTTVWCYTCHIIIIIIYYYYLLGIQWPSATINV